MEISLVAMAAMPLILSLGSNGFRLENDRILVNLTVPAVGSLLRTFQQIISRNSAFEDRFEGWRRGNIPESPENNAGQNVGHIDFIYI